MKLFSTDSTRRNGNGREDLDERLAEASRLMRQSLDTEEAIRISAEALRDALHPGRISFWLTLGDERPRLAHCSDPDVSTESETQLPQLVAECIRRKKPTANPLYAGFAVPLIAPRTGFLGAIHLDALGSDSDQQQFVEALAREASLALETANLYERAVSEKEKSEAILARVGDAVVVTDTRGTVLQWNYAAERITGCEAARAVGGSCGQLLGFRDGDRKLDCSNGCALLSSPARRDPALGQELWREGSDGRRQPLLASVEVVRDRIGVVSEVVHSFRDITRLKEADEAKTLFLATASHELKTPLTVLRGFSEMLLRERDWTDEERRKALEAIERRTLELGRIVERILLSSRIEAGQTKVSTRELDVVPIVRERVEALRAASERDFVLSCEETAPAIADGEALTIVIDHLLDNAVKYSPEGGPIEVSVRNEKAWIETTVVDRGVGMDAEQAARCFDKFWQAESSDVRRFGGTGIGLYIVRSLVQAMGGEVNVSSEPGAGASFTFALKRVGVELPPAEPEEEEPQPGLGEPSVIREFMRQIGIPARR
jgi:PAS domain S-box-containing protein